MSAPLRAVLFDVGGTLVDTTAMPDMTDLLTETLRQMFGERPRYASVRAPATSSSSA